MVILRNLTSHSSRSTWCTNSGSVIPNPPLSMLSNLLRRQSSLWRTYVRKSFECYRSVRATIPVRPLRPPRQITLSVSSVTNSSRTYVSWRRSTLTVVTLSHRSSTPSVRAPFGCPLVSLARLVSRAPSPSTHSTGCSQDMTTLSLFLIGDGLPWNRLTNS